jgi:LacI family transcriptional regulator
MSDQNGIGRAERDPGITIKDVAKHLGISHSTVSRALNDHPHISSKMKERVRRAAAELGYVANASARTLRQASNPLIGLVAPNAMDTLFSVVAQTVAARCEEVGYQFVLCLTRENPEQELRHVEKLRETRAAGIIIIPSIELMPETARLLDGLPAVQFARTHPAINAPAITVHADKGIGDAVRHLIALGHKRIGYIGMPPTRSTGVARFGAYAQALREHGLEEDAGLIHLGEATHNFGRAATSALLRAEPAATAIVYGTINMFEGGLEVLRANKIPIPERMSVTGFLDPPWYRFIDPAISTVTFSLSDRADAAISLLLQQIAQGPGGGLSRDRSQFEPDSHLIARGSTGRPPS